MADHPPHRPGPRGLRHRPDARHVRKNRTRHQEGFKAHVSFEPETGLFTAVELTRGSGDGDHESAVAARLLAGEEGTLTVLGDAAYGTGEAPPLLRDAGHAAVIKPPPLKQVIPAASPSTTSPSTSRPAPLPARPGTPSPWAPRTPTEPGWPSSRACARAARCAGGAPPPRPPGPVRPPPARPAGRRPPRRRQPRLERRLPRWRPPVERAIAWLVARGSRRVPYRGITSNNAWLANRAAALNLRRLVNLGLTRTTSGTWALA